MRQATNTDSSAHLPEPAPAAARALLLELTTFRGKLVSGDYLAQRAAAILALPQEGDKP